VAIDPVTAAPGHPVRFVVTLRNDRKVPLTYVLDRLCGSIEMLPVVPLTPAGRAWTGHLAAFKADALAHANDGPNPFTGVMEVSAAEPACAFDAGASTVSLQPGQSRTVELRWDGDYVPGIPAVPGAAEVKASMAYDEHFVHVCGSFAVFCERSVATWLRVNGEVHVTGTTRAPLTPGQAIDAALSNRTIRAFVEAMPVGGRCGVNLWLANNAERYLPDGPAWDFEEFCEDPRTFIRVALDPWTGTVSGIDECTRSCWR